jgi:lipopolysaccharide export LptBFGC system permease protein LptF
MGILLLVKIIWVILTGLGSIYAVKVYSNANSDLKDVLSSSEGISDAIIFQAKLNRQLAFWLSIFALIYFSVGVISLFSNGNQLLGILIILGLILGAAIITLAVYRIDRGRSRLRSLVGGRRITDKLRAE